MRRLLVLVLLVPLATAGIQLREDTTLTPTVGTPDVSFNAGPDGSTTLGASATSSSTTVALGTLPSTKHVLDLDVLSGGWEMHLELVSANGFGVLDSATIRLDDGSLTSDQIVVALGVVTQDAGLDFSLPSGASSVAVEVVGSNALLQTNTLDLEAVLTPTGAVNPEVRYSMTFTLT